MSKALTASLIVVILIAGLGFWFISVPSPLLVAPFTPLCTSSMEGFYACGENSVWVYQCKYDSFFSRWSWTYVSNCPTFCSGWGNQYSCFGEPTCIPNSYSQCYAGDSYWFDSCDVRGSLKQDCGSSGYAGAAYCQSDDVYRTYISVGCMSGDCFSNTASQKISECGQFGCLNGACVGEPTGSFDLVYQGVIAGLSVLSLIIVIGVILL